MRRIPTAVLISGRGSNMQALLEAAQDATYPAEITLVVSNRGDAKGLARAEEAGAQTAVLPHTDYPSREAHDAALHALLKERGIELICLAGFMRILGAEFVAQWEGRILNIHPSLLPKFPGLNTHTRAIEAGETEHGATVHFVTAELDAGPIIAQEAVSIQPDDTPDALAARVLEVEHRLYPQALRDVAEKRLS